MTISSEALNQKLDDLIGRVERGFSQNEKDHCAIITRQDKTNSRLSKSEKWIYTVAGGLTVLSLIAVPIILQVVTGHFNF